MGCHQEAASPSPTLPSATDINPSRGDVSPTMYQGHQAWEDNGLATLGKSLNTDRQGSAPYLLHTNPFAHHAGQEQ